jgi:hypothetical protein
VLIALATSVPAHGAFPGRNGKIAFTNYSGSWGVWTMNPDGTGQSLLRAGFEPAWSPTGSHLLFVNEADIRRMPADGSSETVLLEAEGARGFANGFWWHSPGWSPDGARIVAGFTDGSESDAFWEEVHVANADGSGRSQLALGVSPTWKADGSEIAYVDAFVNNTTRGIHAIRPDRTGHRIIWQPTEPDGYPFSAYDVDYSPDGTKLVVSTVYPDWGDREIFVVPATGGTAIRLTNNAHTDDSPVWSPDGTKIAFASYRDGNAEIYTMNADGTNQTRITNDAGFQGDPSWQPISGYPRPKSAARMYLPLVPEFDQCEAPNRTHGPPLAFGSCNPPVHSSDFLTVGASSEGFVKLAVLAGTPGPPSDTEVQITFEVTDVRCKGSTSACGNANSTGGADYTGELQGDATLRLTDRFNATTAGGGTDPATVVDIPFPVNAFCSNTADASIGGSCTVTEGPLIPDPCSCEGKRMVVEFTDFRVRDGGADGQNATGGNTHFLRQGLFVP